VISLYYYILIVRAVYLLESDDDLPLLKVSIPTKILTGALVSVMIVFGVFPHHLIEVARAAARALM
jgi:NADH-quinone oxidoreductase subunit N